ncbi:L-Ala-D/L-Glu epimerase [Pseudobythopirellula maris]|uniref:Dipeptide epimerase n=1 Tax=Pseudobythopirellula maris TaxID=2527991 RepID=A0A5C5ZJL9_9BACT|nr:dipeptide epimerase [Pseudobythopirellula maris]TWT87237.1 L-Ala-D/L-Glu epimerase [Pseudobythopirellula maris]
MIELSCQSFDLPLKHEFTIARSSTSVQPTLVVQLGEEGAYGYGEATTNDYYGVTLENMTEALDRVRPLLADSTARDPESLLAEAAARLADMPFALCALDCAVHDLWGKLAGEPLHRLWGLSTEDAPLSDFTIGIDKVSVMVDKIREAPGWPIYKIKLGTPHDDLAIIRALREETDAVFRVDANCGWTVSQAIELSHALRDHGVEFIEQPLPADDVDGAARLFAESALPVIADESCVVESDVERCEGLFHGVNIKLVKCGGLAPARRMITTARRLGLSVMAGCMTESTVGISAIAQLLPLLDHVDMDGAELISKDIATGARLDKGRCVFPTSPGLGVALIDGPLTAQEPVS